MKNEKSKEIILFYTIVEKQLFTVYIANREKTA